MAAGYEDANDASTLRHDTALKLAVGRAPLCVPHLASQPTLSRLEATIAEDGCERVNEVLLSQFLDTPRRRPRNLLLDIDTSEHETHRQQELAFYNDFYGSRCYLPRFLFASVPHEPDQSLVRAELPDHQEEQTDAILDSLEEILATLRERWPKVQLRLRADAGFADLELYTWLEEHHVGYTIGIGVNAVLKRLAEPVCARAKRLAVASKTGSAVVYGSVWYQAQRWEKK
ncbi:MAG: transposase, partial [Bryobacteraceae bacterium]|nr:transposase [Bryobacteraceae bacterium]